MVVAFSSCSGNRPGRRHAWPENVFACYRFQKKAHQPVSGSLQFPLLVFLQRNAAEEKAPYKTDDDDITMMTMMMMMMMIVKMMIMRWIDLSNGDFLLCSSHSHSRIVRRIPTAAAAGAGLNLLAGVARRGLTRTTGRLFFRLLVRCGLAALGLSRDGLRVLLIFVHRPVENVIVLEPLPHEQVTEDLAQVGVVRLVIETQAARVVEIDGELIGKAAA